MPFLGRAGRFAVRALTLLCAVVLFIMMMLTIVDVVLRYVFSSPLPGAYELTELCLAMLIYAGLPLVSLRGQHVTTDFFDAWLNHGMRRALVALINLVCGGTLLAVGWVIWMKARTIQNAGDVTQVLGIVLGPFVYIMSALIVVTALIHFGRVFAPAQDSVGMGAPTTPDSGRGG